MDAGTGSNIALAAMPWAATSRPSAALAALAPYVARELGYAVDIHYLYLDLARRLGHPAYDVIADHAPTTGELLFTSIYYPETMQRTRDHALQVLLNPSVLPWERFNPDTFVAMNQMARFAQLRAVLSRFVEDSAQELSRYAIVGLTTSFGQLYANLALARSIKKLSPSTTIILGGSTVFGPVGPTLVREYEFIDYIVQGEGEIPLVNLLRALVERRLLEPTGGILTRADVDRFPCGVPLSQVPDLDALPMPDYDAFARAAESQGIPWVMPVEGSRGCWWSRRKALGHPRQGCHFCNLNVQWEGYREKTVERMASEVATLVHKYSNTGVFFNDNILRLKGIDTLAQSIAALDQDFMCFYELRAHVSPYDLLCLWEMGVVRVQLGIEGLSTSYLKRLNKGTSVIQNLQAMKVCRELEIDNSANLLLDFPTSTDAEVDETCDVIARYALAYEPLDETKFFLGTGSTVEVAPDDYSVSNIRNAEHWRIGLPEAVYHRLVMFDRAADYPSADWTKVRKALAAWRANYDEGLRSKWTAGLLLFYLDGGTFLRIHDARQEPRQYRLLNPFERDVFIYCCQIRRLVDILAHFEPHPREEITAALDQMVQRAWMYREGERYLTTVPAFRPSMAARRIRAQHELDSRKKQHPRP